MMEYSRSGIFRVNHKERFYYFLYKLLLAIRWILLFVAIFLFAFSNLNATQTAFIIFAAIDLLSYSLIIIGEIFKDEIIMISFVVRK
jgi:hypothetical protein